MHKIIYYKYMYTYYTHISTYKFYKNDLFCILEMLVALFLRLIFENSHHLCTEGM